MNIFYCMQRNIKPRNKSRHITVLTLLFWVWKPLKKPNMGKPVQHSAIEFIMRKYGTLQSLQIHPNLTNAIPVKISRKIPAKSQHPPV